MLFNPYYMVLYFAGIVGVTVAYLAVSYYISWRRLAHIPGPFYAGVTKWWMVKKMLDGRLHTATADACFKYGSLVRIGPNEVVTNDPDTIRTLLNVRSPYQRSDWYEGLRLDPTHDNILSVKDNSRHAMLRTKMASGVGKSLFAKLIDYAADEHGQYAGKDVIGLEDAIDRNFDKLIALFEAKYLSTPKEFKPVDFSRKIQYLMLDIITTIGFGEAFGYLETDSDVYSYLETTEQTIPLMFLFGAFPQVRGLLQSPLAKLFMPKTNETVGLGKITDVARKVVAERFKPDAEDQKDMLGSFVRHGLSQKDTEVEIMVQIFAGSETTGGTIRIIMLHILSNPQVMEKLLEEIKSSDISNPIKESEAKNMPYLQAIIKEGQRILPPAAGLMLKETPASGGTMNGYQLPPGTKIGPSVYGLFHDPKLWGDDAQVFRPERWLDGTPEEIKRKEQHLDLIFGHGKYSCLGKSLALLSINKVFVQLLRNFQFTILDPENPWEAYNVGVFMIRNMNMRITKRVPAL